MRTTHPTLAGAVDRGDVPLNAAKVAAGQRDKMISVPVHVQRGGKKLKQHFHGEERTGLAGELLAEDQPGAEG
jgi:hypothetical protein